MSGSASRPVVCERNRRQSAGGGWGLSQTWLKFRLSSSFFFSQQSADFLSSPPLKEARQVSGIRSAPALLKPGLGRGAAPQGPFPPDCQVPLYKKFLGSEARVRPWLIIGISADLSQLVPLSCGKLLCSLFPQDQEVTLWGEGDIDTAHLWGKEVRETERKARTWWATCQGVHKSASQLRSSRLGA